MGNVLKKEFKSLPESKGIRLSLITGAECPIPVGSKVRSRGTGSWVGDRCSWYEEWMVGPARGHPDTDTVLGVPVLWDISVICPMALKTPAKALPTKS